MSEAKAPKFFVQFNCFVSYGRMVEASLIVSPKWELKLVSDHLHDVKNARVLTLVFRPTKPRKGRRIFTLKEAEEDKL